LGKIIVNLLESCLPPSSFEDAVDASVSGDQGLAAAFVQGLGEAVRIFGPTPTPETSGQQKLFNVNATIEEISDLLAKRFNRGISGGGVLKLSKFHDPETAGQFLLRLNYQQPYYRYPKLEPVAGMYDPAAARRIDQNAFADALQYLSDNKIPWHLVRGENYAIIGEEKPYMEQPPR